jgi:hypothetical protein
MPVRLSVTLRNGELVKKDLEDLAFAEGPRVSAGRLRGRLESARVKLIRYPEAFQGPYPWKTRKQQRYVMMMIRLGKIVLPYRRTGKYGQSWKVEKSKTKHEGYMLISRLNHAKWVSGSAYGTDQARIHRGRWPLLRDVVEEAVSMLPKEIADDIVMVARRKGYQAQ